MDKQTDIATTEPSIFKTLYRGFISFFVNNWKRSRLTLVYFISLGILCISNIGLLGIAINIRYDKIFGNSYIKEILTRFSIADHTFSKALNTFSFVVSIFSSLSIVAVIFSTVAIVSWRWRRVLLFTVDTSLTERLQNLLYEYQFSHVSGLYGDTSLGWNTLFVKAECCGVGTSIVCSFTSSVWYNSLPGISIPVQCCASQTDVYPYESKYDHNCTSVLADGYYHKQGCDTAVENRLKMYSIPFFVFMAVIILAEISCIVMTIYDSVHLPSEPNTLHLEEKANGGKVEISEVDEKPISKPSSTVSDKKDKKKKKEKENSENAAKRERKQSIEKLKSFVNQNTADTENVKDNIKIQSMEETKKENERMRTNTEVMLDLKNSNKKENTKDDKKEEADTLDQHKND
ncbi:unnamed protein product [Mytilus coruscus]|uniref:Uncharacterized protein n=1 Tax=Mytilus coruscus TaxID=42192 RepID=A0A6J8CAD7_MYTCO|nr:unnamed protein product [Mytilus coruscus]